MEMAGFAGFAAWRGVARMVTVGIAAIGVLIAVSGVATLAKVPWDRAVAQISVKFWPRTEGRILAVLLSSVEGPGSAGQTGDIALKVAYEYEVGGARFTGTRASLVDIAPAGDRRLQMLYRRLDFARITQQPVAVIHNPRQPADALLDTSLSWYDSALRGALGLALAFLGFAFVAAALRGPKERGLSPR